MKIAAHADYSLLRIWRKLLITLSTSPFLHCSLRLKLIKCAGVKVKDKAFIGANVSFDGIHPELIYIGNGVIITTGTCILSHFYSVKDNKFYLGEVKIGDNVFIGMNTLIVKGVTIGDNAVIGAGSIITRDIPSYDVWAGNPAKFIKKRS